MFKATVLGSALVLIAVPALAADFRGEVINATEHAEYAAEATDLNTAHMHLHHTLNCLVGPKGAGFDAKELNPCAGSGNGAIPDATDAAEKTKLQAAAAKATSGLSKNDFNAVKKDATDAAAILKTAE
jgi:hypothetical protein